MTTSDTSMWMALNIDRVDGQIRVSARGCRGEEVPFRVLDVEYETIARFAAKLEASAKHGRALESSALLEAQAIQRAMLAGEIGSLFTQLREASGGPLLMRILVHDPELHAIPWEALCNPGQALGFWGTSPDVLPVRGVMTSAPWQPHEIQTAIRVLAIAPTDNASLPNLRQALESRISTGEMEWLEPLEGPAATAAAVLERLRRTPTPHIIHFIGHGGIENGLPVLRVADEDEEKNWLEVELLAQQLAVSFRGILRLVILEACEGAKPTAFASAAEILARAGANAVVAHAWPVRADVARRCSTQLYRSMVGTEAHAGNIAIAMNEARRAVLGAFDASVEALSPVLYLRGTEGQIFDFQHRILGAQAESSARIAVARTSPQLEPPTRIPTLPDKHPSPTNPSIIETTPASRVETPAPHPSVSEPDRDRSKAPLFIAALALLAAIAAIAISFSAGSDADATTTPASSSRVSSIAPATSGQGTTVATQAPPPTTTITESTNTEIDATGGTTTPGINPMGVALRLKTGLACKLPTQCISGFCVDGVCCDSACTGTCKACSTARKGNGADGACAYVVAGRDPDSDCAKMKGSRCDGRGVCSLLASEAIRGLQGAADKLKKVEPVKKISTP